MERSTFRIGIALIDNLPYARQIQAAIEEYFAPFPEFCLVPLYSPGFPRFHDFPQNQFDALITKISQKEALLELKNRCRLVVNCTATDPILGIHSITSDNRKLGRLAGEHLLALKRRCFAFLGSRTHMAAKERLAGFAEALGRRQVEEFDWDPDCQEKNNREKLVQWVASLPKPAGVFAFNDYRAAHVANVALDLGLEIPAQISICGVDNDQFAQNTTFLPLTTVDLDERRIGFRAGEYIHAVLRGERPSVQDERIAPLGLLVRSSTVREMTPNQELNRAIAVLRQNAMEDTSIDEIAMKSGLCRRKMERLFRDFLHSTPYTEILNIRMAKAEQLLQTTHLTIQEIAEQAGFGEARRLCIVFKQKRGMTPTEFRGGTAGTKSL